MSVAVIVPFTPDGAERSRNWTWLRRRLEHFHGLQIIEAPCEGRWSKGRAFGQAVDRTAADVLVFMDADVFVPPDTLDEAIAAAQSGRWCVPHSQVWRLGKVPTQELLDGPQHAPGGPLELRRLERYPPYEGVATGGLVAMPRAAWEVAPLDPRFEGWGLEDLSWRRALETLVGPMVRYDAPLWHLQHPRQGNWNLPMAASKALYRRYIKAHGDPSAMASIIKEFRCSPSTDS